MEIVSLMVGGMGPNLPPLHGLVPFSRLSVVIPNYNYAEYVGAAIESALALDWPDVEVIVVDDGSTDGSTAVIRGFGDRVKAIFQGNMTQYVACNTGFAASTGDAVIFLDSDDMVDRELAREVAAVWYAGVSKVQVQMRLVDAGGTPTGQVLPPFKPMPTPARIRKWVNTTTEYPTPPGSGNVYARWFLEKIFPLDGTCGAFSDSYCIAAAPFAGEVVSVSRPLVAYRRHGRNDSDLASDKTRFSRGLQRVQQRFVYSCAFHPDCRATVPNLFLRSPEANRYRMCSFRLTRDLHPVAGDSRLRIINDLYSGLLRAHFMTVGKRLLNLIWAVFVLVLPLRNAELLILKRYGIR
jgi:glycosyltransferase involved in cell wall biosynthesis